MVAEVAPELEDRLSAGGPPRLEPVSVPGLTTRAWPEEIRLERIEVFEDELVKGDYDTIRVLFFPDGTTEFANLYLTDPSGEARLVELNGFSGAVTVSRPERETEGEVDEGYEQYGQNGRQEKTLQSLNVSDGAVVPDGPYSGDTKNRRASDRL